MSLINIKELYTCSYCPTDGCEYCYNKNWCIFTEERQTVEKTIMELQKKLKNTETMIKRTETEGTVWYKCINGQKEEIPYKELLKKRDVIKEDLKKQYEYVEDKIVIKTTEENLRAYEMLTEIKTTFE